MSDFSVHDLDSLEWYVDKLATIQDKKARIKAQVREIQRGLWSRNALDSECA